MVVGRITGGSRPLSSVCSSYAWTIELSSELTMEQAELDETERLRGRFVRILSEKNHCAAVAKGRRHQAVALVEARLCSPSTTIIACPPHHPRSCP